MERKARISKKGQKRIDLIFRSNPKIETLYYLNEKTILSGLHKDVIKGKFKGIKINRK